MTPRQPRDGLVAVQVLIPALHDAGGDEETVGSCCRIALLGFGTVVSVARRLTSNLRDFQPTHLLDRGGDATAVAVISDLAAIARDRSAIVPAPVLSSPGVILGSTTLNAELAEHAQDDLLCSLSDLCVDRRPYAEAV